MTTFIIVLLVILILLYVHHKAYFESFVSSNNEINKNKTNEPTTLLIFVSKTCGHCVNYNKNYHDAVVKLANEKGVTVKRIFSDEDPDNLFDKFKVMYVPTGFLMKGDKILKNLNSNINPQSVQQALV